jgi:hypothetical protein
MAEGESTWPWRIGFVAVGCLALWLTWRAYHEALPDFMRDYDKIVHFTIGGLLAFFLDGAVGRRSLVVRGHAISASSVVLLVIFGAEELAQRWSVHRTASFADYAADVAGVVVLTWLSRRLSEALRAKPADDVAK